MLMYIISYAIWYSVAFAMLHHFLSETNEIRYPRKDIYLAGGTLFCILVMLSVSQLTFDPARVILYILLCSVYAVLFFKSQRKKHIMCGILYGFFTSQFSRIVHGIFFMEFFDSHDSLAVLGEKYTYPIVTTSTIIVFLICYRILISIYSWSKGMRPTWMQAMSFLIIILFSVGFLKLILIFHTYSVCYRKCEILVLLLLLGLITLNVYFLSYANYMARNDILRRKLLTEEQKNAMSYEYYMTLEKKYSECKQVLHDMKNHMQVLEALYHSDTEPIAQSYASSMTEVIEHIYPNTYSHNKLLNIILYDKKKEATEHSIKMQYEVEEVTLDFLSDYDLSTILCNLFDNAITACQHLKKEERMIEFKLRQINGFIVLCMKNPMDVTFMKESDKRLFFRKVESGIGLNNVKRVVRKYKGSSCVEVRNHNFEFSVFFCL